MFIYKINYHVDAKNLQDINGNYVYFPPRNGTEYIVASSQSEEIGLLGGIISFKYYNSEMVHVCTMKFSIFNIKTINCQDLMNQLNSLR